MSPSRARIRLGQRVNGHRAFPESTRLVRPIDIVVEPIPVEHDADIVHEWGLQSFPASDPPANW